MPVKRKTTRKPRASRKPKIVLVPVPMNQHGGNFFRSLAKGLASPFIALDKKVLKPIGLRPTDVANVALDFLPLGGVAKASTRLVTKGLKKKGLGKKKKRKGSSIPKTLPVLRKK